MQDNINENRLLLGCVGWPHPEWEGGYFPEDLPEDWQFPFCANECACLLISTEDLLKLDEIEDWLDEVPEYFRFYIDSSALNAPKELLMPFQHYLGGVINGQDLPEGISCLTSSAEGRYVNSQGDMVLWHWDLQDESLRELKSRLQGAPKSLQGLVISGDGVEPSRLTEIRIMAELMGVA